MKERHDTHIHTFKKNSVTFQVHRKKRESILTTVLALDAVGLLPDMLTNSWFRWVTKVPKYNAFSNFFKTLLYTQNMFELLVKYCFPMKQSKHCVIQKEKSKMSRQSNSSHVVTQLRKYQTTWLDDLYGCSFFLLLLFFFFFFFFDMLLKFFTSSQILKGL